MTNKLEVIEGFLYAGTLFALSAGLITLSSCDARKVSDYEKTKEVEVEEGGTYSRIAKNIIRNNDSFDGGDYRTLVNELMEINEESPEELQSGQNIDVPDYKVEGGDDKESKKNLESSLHKDEDSTQNISEENSSINTNQNTYLDSLEEMLKDNEGFRSESYDCPAGYRTIGYGFNLEKEGAEERVENLGYDHESLLDKTSRISRVDAQKLLEEDINIAREDARTYLGKENFESIDPTAKMVLVDMAYNMGLPTLNEFDDLREALINEEYGKAAEEIKSSQYFDQTGERASNNYAYMIALSQNKA